MTSVSLHLYPLYPYNCIPVSASLDLHPYIKTLRSRAKLAVDFMTLRPFVPWFYGYTASLGPVLAHARPRALVGHDFMTFSGSLPTGPAPQRVSTRSFLGLLGITRATCHKSLCHVPSMVTEICRIVPKWSPTPVPPPSLGLNFLVPFS